MARRSCVAPLAQAASLGGGARLDSTRHRRLRTHLKVHNTLYPDGAAQAWIAGLAPALAAGTRIAYAITLRHDGSLIGTVDLHEISAAHARAMLGYWIGVPYWGQGYATEAARRLIEHGHAALGLSRIGGACLARNPASAQVMQKIGLRLEGRLIAHECKHGVFEDLLLYGLVLPGRMPSASPA